MINTPEYAETLTYESSQSGLSVRVASIRQEPEWIIFNRSPIRSY